MVPFDLGYPLYPSGRRRGPIIAVLAQSLCDSDQLSGDGGNDDLVRFSGLAEAICEGSQARVVMRRDHGRLKHHVRKA